MSIKTPKWNQRIFMFVYVYVHTNEYICVCADIQQWLIYEDLSDLQFNANKNNHGIFLFVKQSNKYLMSSSTKKTL